MISNIEIKNLELVRDVAADLSSCDVMILCFVDGSGNPLTIAEIHRFAAQYLNIMTDLCRDFTTETTTDADRQQGITRYEFGGCTMLFKNDRSEEVTESVDDLLSKGLLYRVKSGITTTQFGSAVSTFLRL